MNRCAECDRQIRKGEYLERSGYRICQHCLQREAEHWFPKVEEVELEDAA